MTYTRERVEVLQLYHNAWGCFLRRFYVAGCLTLHSAKQLLYFCPRVEGKAFPIPTVPQNSHHPVQGAESLEIFEIGSIHGPGLLHI